MKEFNIKKFLIYWWSFDSSEKFYLKMYFINMNECGFMVLDVLIKIKNEIDIGLIFWRFCWEGICGFCVMNIGGSNGFVCLMFIEFDFKLEIIIFFFLYMYVIKDFVVDMM